MSLKETLLTRRPNLKLKINDLDCFIKTFTGHDRLAIEEAIGKEQDSIKVMACIIQHGVVNEDGSKVFTSDDLPAIEQMESHFIVALSESIATHNKLGKTTIEKKE